MHSPLDTSKLKFVEEKRRVGIVVNQFGVRNASNGDFVTYIVKSNGNGHEKSVTSYASKDATKRPEEIRKEIAKLLSKLQ
jgi:hypothetical protein